MFHINQHLRVGKLIHRREEMEGAVRGPRAHILVLPYPAQGHLNPMLQFSKRLVHKGLKVTLVTTICVSKSMQADTGPIKVETISDGFDENGILGAESIQAYLDTFKTVGSQTLSELIKRLESSGNPVSCVVNDSFLPWALDVAKEFGLKGAPFFTQSCAVNSIFYHVLKGFLQVPVEGPVVSLPGLPPLKIHELPSLLAVYGSYPAFFDMVVNQFVNADKADSILVNSFDKLEPEVVNWMSGLWRIQTIGPTLPSMYLDAHIESDKDYGLRLFEPSRDVCMNWLNSKENESVVYVSFGSLVELSLEQMGEIAWGLRGSNNHFLWVVRQTELNKLPERFIEETSEKGLVVTWCPQLEVLSHRALGCFLTHCGWNSTLEAVSLGVPMVMLPQWTDQTTNAKFVEDEWKMGLRVKVEENGISIRTEIETCIRDIMERGKGKVIRISARTWKESAKNAMGEGGTSNKNIEDFVSNVRVRT